MEASFSSFFTSFSCVKLLYLVERLKKMLKLGLFLNIYRAVAHVAGEAVHTLHLLLV